MVIIQIVNGSCFFKFKSAILLYNDDFKTQGKNVNTLNRI